ncbi:MAG: alpha/beta hydrolase [Kastovskya adunca ATA6-11-RM4]|jgi:hypothetical protein|nr:alpha/beta hydrolase [Kastovskya adunca ATA6-11-RM4]
MRSILLSLNVSEVSLQPWLRLLLTIAEVFAIAYLAACLFLFWRQSRFIFKPVILLRGTPAAFNLPYEELWLPVKTKSGKTSQLHAWWIPAVNPDAPVWLFLHGNGSTIGDEVKRAFWFHQLEYSTLMIDYRGYGRSLGKFPSEATIYEDVEAAWSYLRQIRQISPQQIFLYGHSLGGAIAIELASHHPDVAGLVVEGSFTSMRLMVDYHYRHFTVFPVDLLLHQRFDSLSKVRSLSMPILFIHGTSDRVVPSYMSEILFAAASEPKQLLLVPEAGHHNVGELSGEKYFQAIKAVVTQAQTQKAQLSSIE